MANLLIDWAAIDGNHPNKPASFYFALLRSLPDVDGKIGHLRNWLSDQMSDDDPSLADPSLFIERLMTRATTLGVAAGNGHGNDAVNALGGKLRVGSNNCNYCNAWICTKGTTPKACLSLNPRAPRPKGSKDAHWNFVEIGRAFCKAVPGTSNLKSHSLTKMREAIQQAGMQVPGDSAGGGGSQPPKSDPSGAADGAFPVTVATPVVGDAAANGADQCNKQQSVVAICRSMPDEVTDPTAFADFINSLTICNEASVQVLDSISMCSEATVQVLTRSTAGYELPCSACGRIHPFEMVCGPMLGLSSDPPGPDPAGSCFRSQCEFFCLCDRNDWNREFSTLRRQFQHWRDQTLRRSLDLPDNQGWATRVVGYSHE